jgi:hypothetical protein
VVVVPARNENADRPIGTGLGAAPRLRTSPALGAVIGMNAVAPEGRGTALGAAAAANPPTATMPPRRPVTLAVNSTDPLWQGDVPCLTLACQNRYDGWLCKRMLGSRRCPAADADRCPGSFGAASRPRERAAGIPGCTTSGACASISSASPSVTKLSSRSLATSSAGDNCGSRIHFF